MSGILSPSHTQALHPDSQPLQGQTCPPGPDRGPRWQFSMGFWPPPCTTAWPGLQISQDAQL